MHGEKSRLELHKNASYIFKQILEATSSKTAAEQLLTSDLKNTVKVSQTRYARHCGRSKDEVTTDILQWIPTHGLVGVGRSARIYLHKLYADTGGDLKDLPRVIDFWDGWRKRERERESRKSVPSLPLDEDNDIYTRTRRCQNFCKGRYAITK